MIGGGNRPAMIDDGGATQDLPLTGGTMTGALEIDLTAIGTGTTAGLTLKNTTAAAAGAQQYSPPFRQIAAGWKTDATAASQAVEFATQVRPVQGTAAPTGAIHWLSQINGGGYTSQMNLDALGNLTMTTLTFPTLGGPNITTSARDFLITSGVALGSGADAAVLLAGNYNFYLGPNSIATGKGAAAIFKDENGSIFEIQQFASSYVRLQTGRVGQGIRITTNSGDITTEVGGSNQLYLDTASGAVNVRPGGNVRFVANSTGVGFFGVTPAAKQASAADLTNSVTSGGTSDTIANYTDLTVYANDAAAIRNDIYQLARKLKQVNDALRLYGLLT